MDSLAAIRDTFFQECEEQLAELESRLLMIESGECDPELINGVFRAVHSIKGGAGAFNLDSLVRFSHVFETVLDELRSGRLAAKPEIVKLLLRAADILADEVRAARNGVTADESRAKAMADKLRALGPDACGHAADAPADFDDLDFKPVTATATENVGGARWTVVFKPHAALYAKANEAALILRELATLGTCAVELDASALPPLEALDPEASCLSWTIRLTSDASEAAIREAFEFVESDCDLSVLPSDAAAPEPVVADSVDADIAAILARAQAGADAHQAFDLPASVAPHETSEAAVARKSEAAAPTTPSSATIRVDLGRVDRLIDLVGELVINQAMLSQRVTEAGLTRISGIAVGLDELEQLTREIQDSVMAIRAQPVKSVFQRMPRLVREVAAQTGKSVRLVTEGEATEVDKTVIEKLSDPLTHMIRNAIDHGLEDPERRAAAGKPAEGVIRLAAAHRSGRIIIEVADDGGGIDRPKVQSIAAKRGLITPDVTLGDDEIDNLIFLPGFSTATEVSDISGRGVGMDVVRRSVQALGGRISIASRPGRGSTFTMSLPLTLAVLDGMVVTVEGQTLVIPITAIVETLQPKAQNVHAMTDGAQVIAIRDMFVPLIDVGVALRFRRTPLAAARGVALLIEREDRAHTALLVDAIQGQRQVVIKSLEANYRQVRGVAAATILGDGRVALILDLDTVVAVSRSEPRKAGVG